MSEDHIDLYVALDSDPEVRRYIDGGRPVSINEVVRFVRSSRGHRWSAFRREDGGFVGWFGLVPTAIDERELGYRLRRSCWGSGLATEGARELLRHAFDDLGVARVWAQTMTVNVASRRVMEKCGMGHVRTFFETWPEEIGGSDHGDVEYELLRPGN